MPENEIISLDSVAELAKEKRKNKKISIYLFVAVLFLAIFFALWLSEVLKECIFEDQPTFEAGTWSKATKNFWDW